ncbi:CoA-binding protein [Haladaptatus halobius]|uniref:CoA-binding protein n=1 Tax=Haladaptatus halobius TaxID=2884875 RepID=UPI001D0BA281|nr:CoA-binding protein [Haladaptatus halobius]
MSSVTPPDGSQAAWEDAQDEVGSLLEPDVVAIVGASNTEGKPGNVLLRNVLQNNFDGHVYPINPSADTVLGLDAYPSITDVPEEVDTAVFCVPGSVIETILPDCAAKGVTSIVIVSAGFAEAVDESRQELQRKLTERCMEYGIRAVGPNTTGMVSMKKDLVASFMPFPRWHDGRIAIAAQTGIFAGVYMEELMAREVQKLGYNYSVGLGNKMDLDETDFVRYAGQDDSIDILQLYLECIRQPEEFFPTAAHVAKQKPIILLKSGRTSAGRDAARWHTASSPTVDAEVEQACRMSGIIRANTIPQFTNYAKGFDYQPAPRGRKVAVLSLSGANAVLASDYISQSVLELAELSEATLRRIKELVPEWQPVRNPVDQWLALPSGPRKAQAVPLEAVIADDNVDAIVTIHLASEEPDFDEVGEMYRRAMVSHPDKPVLSYIMGAETKHRWIESLEGTDVPVFESAFDAIDTLEQMYRWHRYSTGYELYDPTISVPGETI